MPEFKSEVLKHQTTVEKLDNVPEQAVKPSGTLHFTISVADVDEAVEFYTSVVGATFGTSHILHFHVGRR